MKSVSEASAKTTAASTSPPGVLPSSATTSTGTSMIRTTVSALGRFTGNTGPHYPRPGAPADGGIPGGAREPARSPAHAPASIPSIARGKERRHEETHPWTQRPRGLRDWPRLHGHVGLLRV